MPGILDQIIGMAKQFEEKTGAPSLSKLGETVDKLPEAISKIPGERQLKLIKDILILAREASKTAPDLDKVIALVKELETVPIEKLQVLRDVLKQATKLLKNAPEELLTFLTSLSEDK